MLYEMIAAGYGTNPDDFEHSYNCAERILNGANEAYQLGLDDRTLHMASGCGAGMYIGTTCGTICAAVMVVGLLETKFNQHQTPTLKPKLEKMLGDYQEDTGSLLCKDLRPVYFEQDKCRPLLLKTAEMLDKYYTQLQAERENS